MSLVFSCCCDVVPPPPDPCPCDCVCQYAWKIQDGSFAYPEAWNGSLFTEEELVGKARQDWFTILFWPMEACNQAGVGTHWLTYTEGVKPQITSYLWIRFEQGVSDPSKNSFSVEAFVSTADGGGDVGRTRAEIYFPTSDFSMPGNCKMATVQYRQVEDGIGGWQVQLRIRIRYVFNAALQEQIADAYYPFPGFEDGREWGMQIPDEAKTWVGSYVPPCDPYGDTAQKLYEPLDGCINNLTIYQEWLNETQYEEKWNDGAGLLDDGAWERWCPTQDFCFQDQIGVIRGERLKSFCPIKDGNGDLIEDEDNLCIFSTPAVP